MITLEEFLAEPMKPCWSAWVSHPGWSKLYVRRGARLLGDDICAPVFTLANIKAKTPGQGTLPKLLKWFDENYGWPVFVECVQNHRLTGWLRRNGFQPTSEYSLDFWKPAVHDHESFISRGHHAL